MGACLLLTFGINEVRKFGKVWVSCIRVRLASAVCMFLERLDPMRCIFALTKVQLLQVNGQRGGAPASVASRPPGCVQKVTSVHVYLRIIPRIRL